VKIRRKSKYWPRVFDMPEFWMLLSAFGEEIWDYSNEEYPNQKANSFIRSFICLINQKRSNYAFKTLKLQLFLFSRFWTFLYFKPRKCQMNGLVSRNYCISLIYFKVGPRKADQTGRKRGFLAFRRMYKWQKFVESRVRSFHLLWIRPILPCNR
jgi:hypothetical protein